MLLAGLVACRGGTAPTAPDAPAVDAPAAPSPIDCETMEALAPGYERSPIATTFSPQAPPRGPRAAPREIAPRTVYRRTAVAQFGGTADREPPRPTLIAFEFAPDTDQLAGSYCVVQASRDVGGVWTHGHYPIDFVPRATGPDDYYVTATLGDNVFPIGFDGTSRELTIYVASGDTAYLETYQVVPPR